MTGAREEVLGRIRAALGPPGGPAAPIPRAYAVSSLLEPAAVVERFVQRVGAYRATVHRTSAQGLPGLIAGILTDAGAHRLVHPVGLPRAWLGGLTADVELLPDDGRQSAEELDAADAVLTGCAVAIAETGTVVLDAGPDQGRRALTLVPDHHLCVVAAEAIVATVPEGLARLDPRRPLTLVSGPSATSDIELERVEGVHGPRALDVIVVTGSR